MAPKRKREDPKESRSRKCPRPTPVPRLLIKGGIEVLGLVTEDDATIHIELFLQPCMGVNTPSIDHYSKWYGYSYDIEPTNAQLVSEKLPTYSFARVPLPQLNDDLTCGTLQMWEAVAVKTEIIGINSLTNCHYFDGMRVHTQGAVIAISGTNFHMFAVGGEPLDVQGMLLDYTTLYPSNLITIPNVTGTKATPLNQGIDPKARTKLTRNGYFPIEIWGPDPSRNENTRYFGSFGGVGQSPINLQFTNTLTTVLLDENGVGPLCKGDGLFITCADVCGFLNKTSGKMAFHGLPRYFDVTLRKRWVKNPYPVTNILSNLFQQMMPEVSGQPMWGPNSQVDEVRIYQGTEPLPGDPDMVRYVDQFGQDRTVYPPPPPHPTMPAPAPPPGTGAREEGNQSPPPSRPPSPVPGETRDPNEPDHPSPASTPPQRWGFPLPGTPRPPIPLPPPPPPQSPEGKNLYPSVLVLKK
ncbi:major capsid protein [Eptesicus serotinus polyomavirus 1]|uniref:Major capsid protein n=1 Tax=Eptesicus serotinus polyomavirus 1 TaxID=2990647 RepID=A0AAE9T986_9POLY|nr:major capsid protein [Eptesicus serotinus polyomavirus 1]